MWCLESSTSTLGFWISDILSLFILQRRIYFYLSLDTCPTPSIFLTLWACNVFDPPNLCQNVNIGRYTVKYLSWWTDGSTGIWSDRHPIVLWLGKVCHFGGVVVILKLLPIRILNSSRLQVPSWYIQKRTCILWHWGRYHTCVRANTSVTNPKIRLRLIQWRNEGQTVWISNN